MDRKEREMGALQDEARLEIIGARVEGNAGYYREELFKAACNGDLQMVRNILEGDNLRVISDEWEVNPLRGVIMSAKTRVSVADILLRHYGHDLLLKAQDPKTGNTLLHLATGQPKKEKLAMFFLKYLAPLNPEKLDSFTKQCFLDAVNHKSQTALHIATDNLLIDVVRQFVLEKQLKINIKDNNQKTVLDLIKEKCDTYRIKDDWKTAWKISILLRGSRASSASGLEDYEDEEDVIKEKRHVETLIMNEDTWNMTTNTILLISTLAFTLVFAAIFTVPQTLASGGGGDSSNATSNPTKTVITSLQTSLGKSTPFKAFVVCLTLACLVMIFVILVIVLSVTSSYEMRALILTFSWFCLIFMGISLIISYIIAIWIYMGYFFTSILIACGVFIALFLLYLAYYFDLWSHFWLSLSNLLSMTLLHGFVVTFLNSYFPKCFVKPILYICPFEK